MSSITTQIHSLAAEVKDRFRQMMDKIHEEAGTSSTGRVRLKTQLDKEEKDRQALERQVKSAEGDQDPAQQGCEERRRLRMQIEKVEDDRAKLGEQVASLEIRVKGLQIFTGMPEQFLPSSKSVKPYKNLGVKDRSLEGKN